MQRYIVDEGTNELILIKGDGKLQTWNSRLTNLLIDIRLEFNDEFKCSNARKFQLWEKIAEEIRTKISDAHWVTSIACDNKWRNLLTTFRKIKLSNKKKCYWEYWHHLDTAFRSGKICRDIYRYEKKGNLKNQYTKRLITPIEQPPEWFLTALEEERMNEENADVEITKCLDRLEDLERQKVDAVVELNNLLKCLIEKHT